MTIPHITVHTAKMEESIAFYRDIAGLSVCRDLRAHGAPIVFLSGGEGETCIELIEDAENACRAAGISVGFHTDDVDARREALKALGYEPTAVISPNPSTRFFFIKDPNGLSIQFI